MIPKISVIVPVYNVEPYLRQCLDSLVGQTLREIEIICINDGSPDDSQRILEAYARADARVRVISQENMGLSGARNTGMRHITGEYTMFLDSDDWLALDCCQRAYAAARQHEADVVIWNYVQERQHSREFVRLVQGDRVCGATEVHERIFRQCFGLYREELAHPLWNDARVNVWGRLYRSQIIAEHSLAFVDTKRIGTEDALFNLYFFGQARSVVTLDAYLNYYRMTNATSLTSVFQPRLTEQWRTLFSMMQAYLEECALSAEYREALDNRIAMSVLWLGRNLLLSNLSHRRRMKALDEILRTPPFREAFRRANLRHHSLMWRVILFCCKHLLTLVLYTAFVLVSRASKMLNRRKKPQEGTRIIDKAAI